MEAANTYFSKMKNSDIFNQLNFIDNIDMSKCSACGKGGDLKTCTACKSVKYCNRDCQIAHRPIHKKICKRAAGLRVAKNEVAEYVSMELKKVAISDDELFCDSPPKEECPICFLPMPYSYNNGCMTTYQPCCGKLLCFGCRSASIDEMKKGNIKKLCPFCRVPVAKSHQEYIERCKARVELGDALAVHQLGVGYYMGHYGLPKDIDKGIELWHKATEQRGSTGSTRAHAHLANHYWAVGHNEAVIMFRGGGGRETAVSQAGYHFQLAAMGGDEQSRHSLGVMMAEDKSKSMKHFMIAARDGYDSSLKQVGEGYKAGHVTKEDYTNTLREYQRIRDEMKSEQRTEAEALMKNSRS